MHIAAFQPHILGQIDHTMGVRRMQENSSHFSLTSLARSLQFPQDCMKGSLSLVLEGQNRVCVENFRGISSYTAEEIKLTTNRKKICITGKNLKIDCYSRDEIEISGCICKLEYL